MHVLVLATGEPPKYLTDALTERKHTFEAYDPRNLAINISEQSGYDRVYHAKETLKTPVRLKANSFDAIICRIGADTMHSASVLRHLTENLGIYSPQNANGILMASDKLWTYQVLSKARVKTINTYFTRRANHVKYIVEQLGGLPIIGKTPTGSKGKGVFVLDSIMSANSVLGLLHKQDIPVMMQRFVKSTSHSVGNKVASAEGKRLIVVGDKVVCAMLKVSYKEDDFRDNLDRGAEGISITPHSWEVDLAVKSAKALGLQFAGVDLIQDSKLERPNDSLVIEVNSNPGTGIIAISGHNYFIDLVELIEKKINKSEASAQKTEDTKTGNSIDLDPIETIKLKKATGGSLSLNEAALLNWATVRKVFTTKQ